MTPSSFSRLSLLTLALLCACGKAPVVQTPDGGRSDGGTTTNPDGGGNPLDGGLAAATACMVLNERRCGYLARCGLIEDTPQAKAECVRGYEVSWCGPLTWPAHVAKGALKFDPYRAEACAQSFLTQTCSEWPTLADSCNRFLLPRVPLGQDCYDGFDECTDGVCRGSSCPRTCQPRALLDEVCTVDSDCRTGLYCKLSTVTPTAGQCAVYGTLGAACESTRQCGEGLQCIAMQCQLLPLSGAGCLAGRCADTSYCEGLGLGDGGVCMQRKGESAPCEVGQCGAQLVCDPLRAVCVKIAVSSGDTCSLAQQCPKGQTCVGATTQRSGLCQAPVFEGEPCASDVDCEAHLSCQATGMGTTTCQRRAAAGEACTSTQTCQASNLCLASECSVLPLPGESCTVTRACRWGLCRDLANMDGGAVCGALLSAGQPCARNDECSSGACSGTCIARCVP